MKKQDLNSEIVKQKIYYFKDSAYLDSTSFVSKDNDPYENDEVFNEAIEIANLELEDYEMIEVEDQGNSMRAIWHKISDQN